MSCIFHGKPPLIAVELHAVRYRAIEFVLLINFIYFLIGDGEGVNNNGDVDDVYTLEFSENELNANNSDKINNDDHDATSSPRFEMVNKVEVSHGLSVTTRQVTNTCFQQIVPSQTVIVYINPTGTVNCGHEKKLTEEVHVVKQINPRIDSFVSKILGPWRRFAYLLVSFISSY